MAVSKVKVVSIIGLNSALDQVTKVCGRSRIFHPDEVWSFYPKAEEFSPFSEPNPYIKSLKVFKEVAKASNIPLQYVPIKNFEIGLEDVEEYIKYMSAKVQRLLKIKENILLEMAQNRQNVEQISHFVGLELDLNKIFSCRYTKVRFGRIPLENIDKLEDYSENPFILFFPSTRDETYYWGVYFVPPENALEVDKIFQDLEFERLKIMAPGGGTPEEIIKGVEKENKLKEKQLLKIEEKIEAFWKVQKEQFMRFFTKVEELSTFFNIKRFSWEHDGKFILVGWVPEISSKEFFNELSKIYGVECSIENDDNAEKHSPPIILKNNRFFKPFELFVGMYGMPGYNEIDPTFLVGITYVLLFGIMFGDLGQGLVLLVVGLILGKLKNSNLGRIMARCGVSASIFGLIYGSFFGFEEVLDPFYKNILGLSGKPIEVMAPKTIKLIIAFAVAVGVALLMISMLLNIFYSIRRKDFIQGVFGQNGLAGLVFYVSIIFGAVATLIFNINIMNIFYILGLIVFPVILIFLQGPLGLLVQGKKNWQPKSWSEYIVQNFFELFEAMLGYLTNTVSFLRVGAYVLVHAGLMLVVFILAEMFTGPGFFIVVFLGNIFVIFMEALLVGIQVLRLEFYEMFSRFFVGRGRAFTPVIAKNEVIKT